MTGTGGGRPQGVADRSGARTTAPRRPRYPAPGTGAWVAGAVAVAGWAALALRRGRDRPRRRARRRRGHRRVRRRWRSARRSRPWALRARLAPPGAAGLAERAWRWRRWPASPRWSALSIALGGRARPRVDRRQPPGHRALRPGDRARPRGASCRGRRACSASAIAAGAAPVDALRPRHQGPPRRCSAPTATWPASPSPSATGTPSPSSPSFAVPGLLWLAGGEPRPRWGLPVAGAGLTLVLVTVLLTYSRGGILALAMAVAVTHGLPPAAGGRAWRRSSPASPGALLPAAYALTDPLLSADQIPTALREDAGAGLGWRLAVGLAAGAVLAVGLARWAARLRPRPRPRAAHRRRRRRGAARRRRRHVRGQRRRARLGRRPRGASSAARAATRSRTTRAGWSTPRATSAGAGGGRPGAGFEAAPVLGRARAASRSST